MCSVHSQRVEVGPGGAGPNFFLIRTCSTNQSGCLPVLSCQICSIIRADSKKDISQGAVRCCCAKSAAWSDQTCETVQSTCWWDHDRFVQSYMQICSLKQQLAWACPSAGIHSKQSTGTNTSTCAGNYACAFDVQAPHNLWRGACNPMWMQ